LATLVVTATEGGHMSTTDVSTQPGGDGAPPAAMEMKLEVVVLPVADVDRAKRFYESIGWRLDADLATGDDFRVVQMTPPGSPASIIFGTGITGAAPGSVDSMNLVVEDIEATRAGLAARGAEVSEVFHDEDGVFHHAGTTGRVPGPDPERTSYGSWASFSDPDGNTWYLQEITTRLPGRVTEPDVGRLAELLLETAQNHDHVEKAAAEHDWWDWYAPYLSAREHGASGEQATAAADRYLKEVRGVEVPR
jgi:catechol 2,3-dioxygenase-like lactoylglutathione lyase family enzyme